MAEREFYVAITKGEDGYLIGEAPQLRGCYNRGKTLDELMENMHKSIEYCLEDDDLNLLNSSEFRRLRSNRAYTVRFQRLSGKIPKHNQPGVHSHTA